MMRSLRLTLVAALLSAAGAQWVLLQAFAWTKMSWERLGTQGVASAVASATDGRHPCRLCLAARAGAEDSQKRQPARDASLRLDLMAPSPLAVAPAPVVSWPVAAVRAAPADAAIPVELPPPCRLPA